MIAAVAKVGVCCKTLQVEKSSKHENSPLLHSRDIFDPRFGNLWMQITQLFNSKLPQTVSASTKLAKPAKVCYPKRDPPPRLSPFWLVNSCCWHEMQQNMSRSLYAANVNHLSWQWIYLYHIRQCVVLLSNNLWKLGRSVKICWNALVVLLQK